MTIASDTSTVLAARDRYFADNGFDPTYSERWVKLRAGKITLWFPNSAGRVRAVKLHDLHHVATGYETTWTGEAEIAAWELASGCGRFVWAWALNLAALPIGLALAPRAVVRAFVRGRHSLNLYRTRGEVDDELLAARVGELRAELRLDRPMPRARLRDVLAFAGYALASGAPSAAVALAVVLLLR